MDKWTDALKGMAPRAGDAGQGMGNRSYAPGLMSGQYSNVSPEARRLYNQLDAGRAAQGAAPGGMPSTQTPGGPQQRATPPTGPQNATSFNPMDRMAMLDYLMGIITSTAPGSKMTTTGGFQNKGY